MKNEIGKWARDMMPDVADWKGERAQFIESKFDGHNYVLSNEGNGKFSALGRQVHIDNWAPLHYHAWLIAQLVERLPERSSVMGELWVPGKPAAKVPSGLLGSERLFFTAYAAPIWEGKAVPNKDLHVVRSELMALGFGVSNQQRFDEPVSWQITQQALLANAREARVEGWVLKQAHMYGWYKVKPVKTADVIVMGWKEHLRNPGQVGAFYIGAFNKRNELETIGKVGSGLTKKDRETLIGDACLGRVMEVEYQDIGANGGLQFPVFIRWRDDKPADQCRIVEA